MQENDNVLYVRFFGTFSVRWNGAQLVKGRDSQFTHLLQILLHTRENGVDRALLIDELFHDREIKDATHSMHVLFYNFKNRLKEMGLPDCAYIVEKSGRFYWTAQIPVKDDTVEFEAAYQKAASGFTEEDKDGLEFAAASGWKCFLLGSEELTPDILAAALKEE